MKLFLDEKEYEISNAAQEDLLNQIYSMGLEQYNKLSGMLQGFLDQGSRLMLKEAERRAYENGASKEEAAMLRPQKGQDASVRYLQILVGGLKEIGKDAEIQFVTDGSSRIESFAWKSQNTGQGGR